MEMENLNGKVWEAIDEGIVGGAAHVVLHCVSVRRTRLCVGATMEDMIALSESFHLCVAVSCKWAQPQYQLLIVIAKNKNKCRTME